MPKWLLLRTATKAVPACRAFRTASSTAAVPITAPSPFSPSMTAMAARSRTIFPSASGFTSPAATRSR